MHAESFQEFSSRSRLARIRALHQFVLTYPTDRNRANLIVPKAWRQRSAEIAEKTSTDKDCEARVTVVAAISLLLSLRFS